MMNSWLLLLIRFFWKLMKRMLRLPILKIYFIELLLLNFLLIMIPLLNLIRCRILESYKDNNLNNNRKNNLWEGSKDRNLDLLLDLLTSSTNLPLETSSINPNPPQQTLETSSTDPL